MNLLIIEQSITLLSVESNSPLIVSCYNYQLAPPMRSGKLNLSGFQDYLHHTGLLSQKPSRANLFAKPRFHKFFTEHVEGQKCFNHLISSILKPKHSLTLKLKVLMAIHHVLSSNKPYFQILIDHSHSLAQAVVPSPDDDPQRALFVKTYQIYLQFLLKLCSNYDNYLRVKSGKGKWGEGLEEGSVYVYQTLNLLRSITPIKEVMIGIGRYYQKENPFIIDVSETIIRDLVGIYSGLHELVTVYHDQNPLEEQKILNEISSLNQDLFIIIHNRYFNQVIQVPPIKWINEGFQNVQRKVERKRTQEGMEKRANTTQTFMEKFQISEFESTYFSKENRTQENVGENEIY